MMSSPSSITARANARGPPLRERVGLRGHAQHHHDRQRHETDAGEHRRSYANDGFDLAMDAEPYHHSMERDRDDDRLEVRAISGCQIEVRRVLHVACQATESVSTAAWIANTFRSA